VDDRDLEEPVGLELGAEQLLGAGRRGRRCPR
jgi:hypothetical protein